MKMVGWLMILTGCMLIGVGSLEMYNLHWQHPGVPTSRLWIDYPPTMWQAVVKCLIGTFVFCFGSIVKELE